MPLLTSAFALRRKVIQTILFVIRRNFVSQYVMTVVETSVQCVTTLPNLSERNVTTDNSDLKALRAASLQNFPSAFSLCFRLFLIFTRFLGTLSLATDDGPRLGIPALRSHGHAEAEAAGLHL